MTCGDIIQILEKLSPPKYACEWDNVGLLVGRRNKEIKKVMVTLDATMSAVDYATEHEVDMIITHHPMIFSSFKQVNEDNFTTEKILKLAEHGISCYAMHTNFDAVGGMAQLAAGEKYLNLSDVAPIEVSDEDGEGMGRYGKLPYPMTAKQMASYVKEKFNLPFVFVYQRGNEQEQFDKIAVMPGSGKSDMKLVKQKGYDLYLTGDYGHHEGLDAMDMGMTIIDATHYGLEHIFIAFIHDYLNKHLDEAIEITEYDMGMPVQLL